MTDSPADLERRRRAEALFDEVLPATPERRAELVRELARGDGALVRDVESLLEHHAASSGFLGESLVARELRAPQAEKPEQPACPARIGRYRVLDVLGEGGMGVVYRAEQDGTRREVALKIIRPGLASARTLKRFEHEARVLARLEHPGIAQIFDAGTADDGAGPQPYFAMELVRGEMLTAFADAHHLGTRARVELLAQIADALDHAHRRGVVHRDLKPSNVLVEQPDGGDGRPRARVLDFGVARVVDEERAETSLRTDVGQIIGTLAYMSPEQAGGDSTQVGPASDVYALGLVGYELLSGRLPYETAGRALPDAVRIVREQDPTPISRVVPALRGDVDTIFGKALEKEPARRYASAAELAADLRRYLEDRPIVARAPSRTYVLAKFARRNKVLVGGLAAVFVALVAGTIGTSWQAVRAADAAERADGEAAIARIEERRAKAVARFQRDMLTRMKPTRDGRDVKLVDVLDSAAAGVELSFGGDPAAEEAVHSTLGESYEVLGLLPEAEREYRAAAEGRSRAYGEDAVVTWEMRRQLGNVLLKRDSVEEAERVSRGAFAALEKQLGFDDARTLSAAHAVVLLEDRLRHTVEAENLARRILEARRRAHPDDRREIAVSLGQHGSTLWHLGKLEEAEQELEESVAIQREVERSNEPSLAIGCSLLANVLRERGKLERAEELYREAVEIGRRLLGEEHHDLWVWLNNLASVLEDRREYAEAEPIRREVLERRMKANGEEHEQTLIALNNLAMLLTNSGRLEEAEPLHARALEIKERLLGPNDRSTLTSRHNLALVKLLRGDLEGALPHFQECAERARSAYPPTHWMPAKLRESYGVCLERMKRFDESEKELLAALEEMRAVCKEGDARVRAIDERLHDLYVAWEKPEKAKEHGAPSR